LRPLNKMLYFLNQKGWFPIASTSLYIYEPKFFVKVVSRLELGPEAYLRPCPSSCGHGFAIFALVSLTLPILPPLVHCKWHFYPQLLMGKFKWKKICVAARYSLSPPLKKISKNIVNFSLCSELPKIAMLPKNAVWSFRG